jgi:RimJ/RimL family protein N-acetyltransferase
MTMVENSSALPIGPIVDPLPPGRVPDLRVLQGTWVTLEPVNVVKHGKDLFASINGKGDAMWRYMGYGPFAGEAQFLTWLKDREAARDPWFYAFVNCATSRAVGMGAFMRADAANGVIEIGHIWMSPELQRTREATEVIFLMMAHAFDDLEVRRLEWKCDSLNAPSRRAALRFGFSYEGIFRQHFIVKGRNRDTAWFSVITNEWPQIKLGFKAWLAPGNFASDGNQKTALKTYQPR